MVKISPARVPSPLFARIGRTSGRLLPDPEGKGAHKCPTWRRAPPFLPAGTARRPGAQKSRFSNSARGPSCWPGLAAGGGGVGCRARRAAVSDSAWGALEARAGDRDCPGGRRPETLPEVGAAARARRQQEGAQATPNCPCVAGAAAPPGARARPSPGAVAGPGSRAQPWRAALCRLAQKRFLGAPGSPWH